jgi:hypothetical protein
MCAHVMSVWAYIVVVYVVGESVLVFVSVWVESSVCAYQCKKSVNAGSLGSHLISYLAVLFRNLMAWG